MIVFLRCFFKLFFCLWCFLCFFGLWRSIPGVGTLRIGRAAEDYTQTPVEDTPFSPRGFLADFRGNVSGKRWACLWQNAVAV